MEIIYPYALIVHLFCAIVFVGYLIVEFVFFAPLFKKIPKEWSEAIKGIPGGIESKIMPPKSPTFDFKWRNDDFSVFGGRKWIF